MCTCSLNIFLISLSYCQSISSCFLTLISMQQDTLAAWKYQKLNWSSDAGVSAIYSYVLTIDI